MFLRRQQTWKTSTFSHTTPQKSRDVRVSERSARSNCFAAGLCTSNQIKSFRQRANQNELLSPAEQIRRVVPWREILLTRISFDTCGASKSCDRHCVRVHDQKQQPLLVRFQVCARNCQRFPTCAWDGCVLALGSFASTHLGEISEFLPERFSLFSMHPELLGSRILSSRQARPNTKLSEAQPVKQKNC